MRKYPFATVSIVTILVSASLGSAHAATGPGVDSPSNTWTPYGPMANQLRFQFYDTDSDLFNAFQAGRIDLADFPVPRNLYTPYDTDSPDFLQSPLQAYFTIFGIAFNQENLTLPRNNWLNWGCNFQHGNSPCGVEIREAIAHLVDRPKFATDVMGDGFPLADPVSPSQTPSGSPLAAQNSWDTLSGQTIAGLFHPPTMDAFNIAPDPGGFPAPGSPDFCAARDHLIAANIGLKDDNKDCIIDSDSPGLANIVSHPLRFIIRRTYYRLELGLSLLNAINQVFGAPVVFSFDPCGHNPLGSTLVNVEMHVCIFPFPQLTDPPAGPVDDWDMYTYGYQFLSPLVDQLQDYDSLQASDMCGGIQHGYPVNWELICLDSFDQHARAAAGTNDFGVFTSETLAALDEFGKHVANLPVFSTGFRSLVLRDMAGAVNQRGVGYSNFWSALNAKNNQTYTPENPIYAFGGGTNTLRRGQLAGVLSLNPFNAVWPEELNVLGEVYDTLFRASPVQPANILCWICNTYTRSVDANGNTHFLVELRQTLRWHDGVPLDAKDVKFSLLNLGFYYGIWGMDVNVLSPLLLEITMNGKSVSHLPNLSTVLIIPRHLWELSGDTTYGDVGIVDPEKIDYYFDPVSASILIGSGPYVCRSVFPEDLGRVGTGCIVNPDGTRGNQEIYFQVFDETSEPSVLTLQVYNRTGEPGVSDPFVQYMRSFNPAWATGQGFAAFSGQFQEFSWADRYDNAAVTVLDLASVGACVGKSDSSGCLDYSYWLRPAFHPSTPDTISTEVAIVASHLDDTWVYPYSWSGIQGQQPGQTLENIVPFTP